MHHGCLLGAALFGLAVVKFLVLLVLVILFAVPTLFVGREFGEMLRAALHKQTLKITGQSASAE